MRKARPGWSAVGVLTMLFALALPVRGAERGKDAHKIFDEATAAFGLGRYAEAAEKYEQAFTLRPDPALLYNAAQSYRLAGNKTRALELYRNCLRLFPDFSNADDARNHVAALRKQIDDEQRAATTPPAAVAPAPVVPIAPLPSAMPQPALTTAPPPAPPPTAPAVVEAPVAAVSQTGAARDEDRPVTQKAWFWVAIGAAAVAVGAVAIALATRGTSYPDPTFGKASGN